MAISNKSTDDALTRDRWSTKVVRVLRGERRDPQGSMSPLALAAITAWVTLGADSLSSTCYGPGEAFRNLADHLYLAPILALAIVGTVLVISECYRHIIEEFPNGAGGYTVTARLLGRHAGVVAGCALVVDQVLTITVSLAAAGEAVFSVLGPHFPTAKLIFEFLLASFLVLINVRGVRTSFYLLLPLFVIFILTHGLVIIGTLISPSAPVSELWQISQVTFTNDLASPQVGWIGLLAILLRAYALGAGTYTGIEAVSTSMTTLREPRIETGKRTMSYIAVSLSLLAGGLILAYLVSGEKPTERLPMNYVLVSKLTADWGWQGTGGALLNITTMATEALLLVIAAQIGFIGGPRTLAAMARDHWVPHWFGNLSERLVTQNGVILMGFGAIAVLFGTKGNLAALLVLYAINVFITFMLSMLGMSWHWWQIRARSEFARRRLALFGSASLLCLIILSIMVFEKFHEGGWRALLTTGAGIALCYAINNHYRDVARKLAEINKIAGKLPKRTAEPIQTPLAPKAPTAVILVKDFGGFGIRTFLNAVHFVPNYFKNVVFVSVGVIDSGNFKGVAAVTHLSKHTEDSLKKYVTLARRMGFPADSRHAVGPDAVNELENLCREVALVFPRSVFFASQLIFVQQTWFQRVLHNETAFALQRRLQDAGLSIVILPTQVD